jgi:hypothetical protein
MLTSHARSFALATVLALAGIGPAVAQGTTAVQTQTRTVADALKALAERDGFEVDGAVGTLSQTASAAPLPADTERALTQLLRGQQFLVVRAADPNGQVRVAAVTILSGERGAAPTNVPPRAVAMAPSTPTPSTGGSTGSTGTAGNSEATRVTSILETTARQQAMIPTAPGDNAGMTAPTPPPPQPRPPNPSPNTRPTDSMQPIAPPQLTPEQQAAMARMTQQAVGDLNALVRALDAACPTGATCN